MSGTERQTFLVLLLRPLFSIPLERLVLFLNLLPVMEGYFLLQQNPFITPGPEHKTNSQQALLQRVYCMSLWCLWEKGCKNSHDNS